jgi:hypothetical protein
VLAAASPYLKQLLLTASPTGDLLDDQVGLSSLINLAPPLPFEVFDIFTLHILNTGYKDLTEMYMELA